MAGSKRPATARAGQLPRSRRATCAALIVLVAAVAWLAPATSPALAAAGATSRFQAVTPIRLADTRAPDCTCTRLDPSTIRVQVAGRNGVPADAVAAALTVTVSGARATGYATVWPSASPRQETSTLNWSPGQTRANGTIVQLGQGGAVDVYIDGGLGSAAVIVDATGAFVPADGSSPGSGAGHFRAVAPGRVLDTRGGPRLGAGATRRVPLPAGVPADATALAVNVTATGSLGFGYLTAFAAGTPLPATSTVNTDGPDQTRAATVIVPVSALGIDLYSSSGTHALVDVFGWFTAAGSAPSADGLFVPVAPIRLFDTRQGPSALDGGDTLDMYADSAPASAALGQALPASSALVFNATSAGAASDGYLTAFPADTAQPATSSLNWAAGETVANLTISPTSTGGVSFFASARTHVLADLTGYFTGAPVTPPPPPPVAGATQDPAVAALVASGVPSNVGARLTNVEMGFLPYEGLPANDTCVGTVGQTFTRFSSSGKNAPWQVTFQRISLAGGFVTACPGTLQGPSGAAHEVGHVLAQRWIFGPQNSATQTQRKAQVEALSPGGEECMAESIAQALFAMKGVGPYSVGYGGNFQSCATAPSTQALAQQIIAAAIS